MRHTVADKEMVDLKNPDPREAGGRISKENLNLLVRLICRVRTRAAAPA